MSHLAKIGPVLLLAALPGLLACDASSTAPTQTEETGASVALVARVDAGVAADLVRAEVLVTGDDMSAMRLELAVDGDRLVGTVADIPAGVARQFAVAGYDAAGVLVVSGSARLDLAPGQAAPLSLSLQVKGAAPPPRRQLTVEVAPGVPLDMVWIEPGTFTMGSPLDEWGRNGDEGPRFEVELTRGFYLGRCEVTQRQWEAVTGERPWSGDADEVEEDPERPAVHISWADAEDFIARLNAAGAPLYRLPTEAEWEYAGRAGTETLWSFGDAAEQLDRHAWWADNASPAGRIAAQVVGLKDPNPWGLYDMHGNVWEWVDDWLGDYPGGAQIDPRGPARGTARVFRGGSFKDVASFSRSAQRCWNAPDQRFSHLGLRLVRLP